MHVGSVPDSNKVDQVAASVADSNEVDQVADNITDTCETSSVPCALGNISSSGIHAGGDDGSSAGVADVAGIGCADLLASTHGSSEIVDHQASLAPHQPVRVMFVYPDNMADAAVQTDRFLMSKLNGSRKH